MEKRIDFEDLCIRKVITSVTGVSIFGIIPQEVFELNTGFLLRYYQNGKQKDLLVNELTENAKVVEVYPYKKK
ncbi:MAG: hypothetical protein ACRCZ9_05605 [Fusobacteriaceae bacterium]